MEQNFASLYESFSDPAFYDRWFELLAPYLAKPKNILDLGCGSGTLLALLQAEGHHVSGVDTSAEMLSLAADKLGKGAQLFESDMVDFFTNEAKYDIIISTCDSLNYLSSIEKVGQVFSNAASMLAPGGFFLFDVHSDYTFTERFMNWSYGDASEDISLIWNIAVSEPNKYEHYLTFFSAVEKNAYQRYDALQVEYFYPEKALLAALKAQEFDMIKWTSDFKAVYEAQGQRTFFVAQKQKNNITT